MSVPFVSPDLLESLSSGFLLAHRIRQSSTRETSAHSHPCGQLLGTVTGLIRVSTSSGQWMVPSVSAIWLPPHVEHEFVSLGAFDGWSIYVSEQDSTPIQSEPFVLHVSSLLAAAVMRAVTWDENTKISRKKNVSNVILDELAATPEDRLSLPMPRDIRLIKIAKALASNPAQKQSFIERAKEAGISPRTLSRRFIAETGLTFRAWRQRALLLRSLELLADGASVTTVAFDLGYETVSAFIDLFRNHFGVTPSKYVRGGF